MQTANKVSQQQLTGASGQPVTCLRFSGDISSASKDAIVGTYQALDKASHKTHSARLQGRRIPQLLRHRARHPGPHGSQQVRPDHRHLRSHASLHQGLHHGRHHQVRHPLPRRGRGSSRTLKSGRSLDLAALTLHSLKRGRPAHDKTSNPGCGSTTAACCARARRPRRCRNPARDESPPPESPGRATNDLADHRTAGDRSCALFPIRHYFPIDSRLPRCR